MKICGISDIHGEFITIPQCDVLCICGDIVGLNDQRDINKSRHWWYNRFTSWVNKTPCDKVIITPGNHDFFIERAFKEGWLDELKQDLSIRTNGKLILLIDEEYIYNDVKFYGTPWIKPIPWQINVWAFEMKYAMVGPFQFENIPKDVDILISHDSPYHNDDLYEYSKNVKYHLYGHWHDGEDNKKVGKYNCSILNNCYRHKKENKIQIIETFMVKDEKDFEYEVKLSHYNDMIAEVEQVIFENSRLITNDDLENDLKIKEMIESNQVILNFLNEQQWKLIDSYSKETIELENNAVEEI